MAPPSVRAAIQQEPAGRLVVDRVDLDLPHAGEVRVKLVASAVCYSDLQVAAGERPYARPLILGHEGAGIVEDVGPGVEHVAPGDPVILGLAASCGVCRWCLNDRPVLCNGPAMRAARVGLLPDGTSRARLRGEPVRQYRGVGTFAESVIVWGSQCVPVGTDVPLDKICLIGCSVLTGVGAAINTARVRAGSSCVVIGCGGIG
ncbi:MAG TPA: alcohol dehydrogenase catalytic domain-containing protein, partial [Dehalococcoidia bacterium]|nr:alcohol dehydrogenase catalytic domain-containing protein [Dehalococcoidia bacterium]